MQEPSLKKTEVFKVDPKNPDAAVIARAAKTIRVGGLVAFPTETVYGIAADMTNQKTIDRLYEVKKRFRSKPFTVHISESGSIKKMGCAVPKKAKRAIDKFWPGALTIILKTDDGRKIGFRMPANEVALRLIEASGVPVVAPSANISGNDASTDAKSVLKDLDGRIEMIIDAGATRIGIESTVADFTVDPPVIIREGAISKRALLKVISDKKPNPNDN